MKKKIKIESFNSIMIESMYLRQRRNLLYGKRLENLKATKKSGLKQSEEILYLLIKHLA